MDPALIGGGLKLLGGLLGRRKGMTPSQSIRSTAKGARRAAEEFGLSPLTLLGASNATAGVSSGDPPPLASLSILGDLITENYGEDANQRREFNELQTDLLRIQLDQARAAVYPPPATAVPGAVLNGGRTVMRTESPVTGAPFLDEDDRGEARVDERDNTVSFQSHGQETVVPVGPDLDEVITGMVIEANNWRKARREMQRNQTVGDPLSIPPGAGVNRIWELMPPIPDPEVERLLLKQSNDEFWDNFLKTN